MGRAERSSPAHRGRPHPGKREEGGAVAGGSRWLRDAPAPGTAVSERRCARARTCIQPRRWPVETFEDVAASRPLPHKGDSFCRGRGLCDVTPPLPPHRVTRPSQDRTALTACDLTAGSLPVSFRGLHCDPSCPLHARCPSSCEMCAFQIRQVSARRLAPRPRLSDRPPRSPGRWGQ